MSEDLERRIQQALDAGRAPHEDAELAAELEADPGARALASELQRLDAALRQWPQPARDEQAWEALAERIEGRLDEPLEPMADPTAPPAGDDLGVLEESSGTYERSSGAAPAASDEPALSEVQATRSQPAPTQPAPRRGALPWGLAAAAAAVLGLGVAAASLLGSDGEDERVALAPAAGEPSTAPATGGDDAAPSAPSAEPEEGSAAEQTAADPQAIAEAQSDSAEQAEADEGSAERAAEVEAERRRRLARQRALPSRRGGGSSGAGGASSAEPKTHQRPSSGGGLAATPSEEAIQRAMREVASKVKACAAEPETGPAVRVTVRGSTGRVQQVKALGSLADTERGVCIERAVEHVRLPPFEHAEHTFVHRFRR